jgi:hypothetical protein
MGPNTANKEVLTAWGFKRVVFGADPLSVFVSDAMIYVFI